MLFSSSLNALCDVVVSVNVTDAGSGKPSGSRASSTKTSSFMDALSAIVITRVVLRNVNLGPIEDKPYSNIGIYLHTATLKKQILYNKILYK